MHQLLPLSARHPTMAPMEHRKPSIEFIHSFYSGERKLFSRMTSSLEIDGDLAFKIISYWLWLEENINKDVIHSIHSLSDDGLKRICSLGEQVLTNAAKSDSSTAQKALSGVNYFLKAVCCKVIDDLKDKTEYEKAKKALQELDLQEFLCKPDPSLIKSCLSSGDGSGSRSSGTGMHMQSNNGFLSSIAESSSSKVSISQSGSYSGGENREVRSQVHPHNDCAQNSSQLSATAQAYLPSRTSQATSFPMVIPANNFPVPPVEHMIESSAIVPHTPAPSALSGVIVPHLPALPPQSGAIMPHLPAFAPQNGAIVPHLTALAPQNGAIVTHMPSIAPQNGAIVPYMPAPPSSAVVPHMPAVAPLSGGVVFHLPALTAQSSMIVQQLPAFCPQSGTFVAHIPVVSAQSSAIAPSQNSTNVFQSHSAATNMIINAQNILQPAPALVPPRRLHPDERTLFVTFSNGSPLTSDELHEFFRTHYKIEAESIYIEEPSTIRPPQYAHVTFYNPESVEYVLNGHSKVKFRTKGKHLWARRFIPRRRRRWGQNAH